VRCMRRQTVARIKICAARCGIGNSIITRVNAASVTPSYNRAFCVLLCLRAAFLRVFMVVVARAASTRMRIASR